MADPAAQTFQGLPISFAQVEELVRSLYQPGQGKKIAETEATLRVLQRSPQGWDLADALLGSKDEQVRFFGALTFTVKLNADSAGLSEEDSEQLLLKLIHHLISHPIMSIATRKLCSTLATYFCKRMSAWTRCVRSLVCSFSRQVPCLDASLTEMPSTWDVLPQLTNEQLLCLLELSMNLADEGKKLTQPADRTVHERMLANIEDMEVLLQVSFGRGIQWLSTPDQNVGLHQTGENLASASIKCFVGWVFYSQSEIRETPEKLRYLRSVTELAFMCLEYNVDDSMDLIAEILENYPGFFEPKHLEMLWKAIMSPWGVDILRNFDAESVLLARIIVAYAHILLYSKVLYQEPDTTHNQQVISVLHELLRHPSTVGVEDDVSPVVIDFWANYMITISGEAFEYTESTEKPAWLEKAKANMFMVVSELLPKITYPPREVTKVWDKDTKMTLQAFRQDVRDLIQDAYDVLQAALLDQFIQYSSLALAASKWLELEAGLYSLNSIADGSAVDIDERLKHLLSQPLFTIMAENLDIPPVTRRTAVDMVAQFNNFFLRNPQFLPEVLRFLFSALGQANLAQSAAKSFASLCSQCRKSLTGELAAFFQMYEQFLSYETAEEITKSKVMEGIAAIVQAQDSDEHKQAGVQRLFQYIAQDAMRAVQCASEGNDPEQGQVLALTTLKCLACIGKALQASDEEIIDLETDHEPSPYWTQGPGKQIQNQVTNFVNYLTSAFVNNDQIIEAACNVLRSGYRESVPGPFVLPPSATVNFISKTSINTPRLPYVLDTACCFVASHKLDQSEEYSTEARRLLRHILSIMHELQRPSTDPEISVGCIELIQKFINTNAQVLKAETAEVLKGMFDFSIECIKSPDVLPKRAAAALWTDIFELCGNTGSPHRATGQEIVNHFGPAVAFALIYNICGEVDGSSLQNMSTPLRRLINFDRNAKAYIVTALQQQLILQKAKEDPTTEATVRRFTEAAMRNARNGTAFKETVKEFWQKCKQMQMQFAPAMMYGHARYISG
jgi:hypothetical protein